MPLLGFTIFKEKILDGTKRQTIRLARKHPIKEGDKLYLYWRLRTKQCQKIGETICTGSYRQPWYFIKQYSYLATKDGFDSHSDFINWFESHHHPTDDTLFDVIRWSYPLNEGNKK